MTDDERSELLRILFTADEPEILVGRVGPGDGVLAFGLVRTEGTGVTFRAASPRAAALIGKLLEGEK